MYLYNSHIFLLYILTVHCAFEEPTNYLTKEKVKVWLNNFTKRESPTNPYCSICCVDTAESKLTKICGKHTMCIYQEGVYGPGCKGVLDIPFIPEEIDVIVDAHNTLRNRVALGLIQKGNPGPQPQASNMREVEWNDELARIAHRWASQCVYGHDSCRDLVTYPVGQNIAKGTFAINYDISFIADWFDHVQWMKQFDLEQYQIPLHSPLGHYTQLVWADTYQIGCDRVLVENDTEAKTSYHEHFICNYGPTGNIPGQAVYKIGKPCTNCPEGTGCSVDYVGLCKNELVYDTVEEFRNIRNEETLFEKDIGRELGNGAGIKYLSDFFIYIFMINYFCFSISKVTD